MKQSPQQLDGTALHAVFIEQMSILYNAKVSLTNYLPQLIEQATFKNLKEALQEDLDETQQQMSAVKAVFDLLHESWLTNPCLAINAMIEEAHQQVTFKKDKHFESDMSILYYMSIVENLQAGACNILHLLASKLAYHPYEQLIAECLDVVKENSSLFYYVTKEYLLN